MDAQRWDERYGHDELLWTAEPNRFLVAEIGRPAAGTRARRRVRRRPQRGVARRAGLEGHRRRLLRGRPRQGAPARRARARRRDLRGRRRHDLRSRPPSSISSSSCTSTSRSRSERARSPTRRAAVAPGGTLLVVGHDITNITDGVGGPQDPAVLYGPDDVVAAISPVSTSSRPNGCFGPSRKTARNGTRSTSRGSGREADR